MSLRVVCPDCRAQMTAPDSLAGRAARCPACGGRVPVIVPRPIPAPSQSPAQDSDDAQEPEKGGPVMNENAISTRRAVLLAVCLSSPVILAALLILLILLAAGGATDGPANGAKVYVRADLEKKVKGLSDDQLRRVLGDPDDYGQSAGIFGGPVGDGYYTYKKRTRKTKDAGVEDNVVIITQRGRATIFIYSGDPPLRIDPNPKIPISFR